MHLFFKTATKGEIGKMKKLFKSFISIICVVSILCQSIPVQAENIPIPASVEPDIRPLTGRLILVMQGTTINAVKYLALGGFAGEQATLIDPFGREISFPFVMVVDSVYENNVNPSEYILDNLSTEFRYEEWDLEANPEIQLKNYPGYEVYVGNVKGQPTQARWGIRKTGVAATGEWPLEHVLDYKNADGEWIRAMTRCIKWGEIAPVIIDGKVTNYDQVASAATLVNNPDIYWKEIQELDEDNISPLINNKVPYPDKSVNVNNEGTISDILLQRSEVLYNACDFLTGITVTGAVTRQQLTLSEESLIPTGGFKIEHDTADIAHLVEGDSYTKIGFGDVISKVMDYEDDVTIFTQRIVVSADGLPDINIYRAGTDIAYQREWMSNHQSADSWRRNGLDIQASSTFDGTYDLVTSISNEEAAYTNLTKHPDIDIVLSDKITNWVSAVDTLAGDIPVTSIIYPPNNRSIALSDESTAKYMRFDSTVPTISEVRFADNGWETVIATDAADVLSGLEVESGGVYYKFVEHGETIDIMTPSDGTDWSRLTEYGLPEEPGAYDLYVYAKDNATNRSQAIRLNSESIIVPKNMAMIRLEVKVADDAGNEQDIFMIHLQEGNKRLGSVALKQNEISGWMYLDMTDIEPRTIKICEVVPMDYETNYRIYLTNTNQEVELLEENKVVLNDGDEITVTIENKFNHAGFFRDKGFVRNYFDLSVI